MPGPPPLDLNALEAALVPSPEGLGAWARTLCELEPKVGLRAAIASARALAPFWKSAFPQDSRFADTLAAAEAGLEETPASRDAAEAEAVRTWTELASGRSRAHEAQRVAARAAEAASHLGADETRFVAAVQLGLQQAAALSDPGLVIQAVQSEVLSWVLSGQGPIAAHVATRLAHEPGPPDDHLMLAARLGHEASSNEVGSRSGRFARYACPLDEWATSLGPAAARRAALIAAELVAPIYIDAFPQGRRMEEVLVATRVILNGAPTREGPTVTLDRAERRLRRKVSPPHDALRVAISALKAAHTVQISRHATDALCRAATLHSLARVVNEVQSGLLDWLDRPGPRVPLAIKAPHRWDRGPPACSREHCIRPAVEAHAECEAHCPKPAIPTPALEPMAAGATWYDDHPKATPASRKSTPPSVAPWRAPTAKPDEPLPPPPMRAEWKIGHKVRVKPSMVKTNLGDGVVVDLEFVRGTDTVKAALVRFEHGPAEGVWYSVNTLDPFEDLLGSKLV